MHMVHSSLVSCFSSALFMNSCTFCNAEQNPGAWHLLLLCGSHSLPCRRMGPVPGPGPRSPVPGPRSPVLGPRSSVLGPRSPVPGPRSLVPGPRVPCLDLPVKLTMMMSYKQLFECYTSIATNRMTNVIAITTERVITNAQRNAPIKQHSHLLHFFRAPALSPSSISWRACNNNYVIH